MSFEGFYNPFRDTSCAWCDSRWLRDSPGCAKKSILFCSVLPFQSLRIMSRQSTTPLPPDICNSVKKRQFNAQTENHKYS